MQVRHVDCHLDVVAGPDWRADREATRERTAVGAGLRAELVSDRPVNVSGHLEHLLRHDGLRVDLQVREQLRA